MLHRLAWIVSQCLDYAGYCKGGFTRQRVGTLQHRMWEEQMDDHTSSLVEECPAGNIYHCQSLAKIRNNQEFPTNHIVPFLDSQIRDKYGLGI